MVAGRHSQLWPCTYAEASDGRNRLGRAVIVEGAGHATNLDQPDEFNEILLRFVAEL